jgi:ribosomal protein L7Ae-like RNA K-turn-binding protein
MSTIAEGAEGLVGLARRGGRLAVGFGACEQALAQHKVALIILAEDLSASTASKIHRQVERSRVSLIVHGSKAAWGRALGRDEVGVLAVLDKGMAEAIMSKIKNVD